MDQPNAEQPDEPSAAWGTGQHIWQRIRTDGLAAMPAGLAFMAGALTIAAITILPFWASAIVIALAFVAGRSLRASSNGDDLTLAGAPDITARSARHATAAGDWTTMLDALPDAAILVDRSERISHLNDQARVLFPRLIAGVPLSSRLRQPELIEALDAARQDTSALEVELSERVPIERRITARLVKLTASHSPPGNASVLITFRDLSEEDRLARTRADFVANASHELRTPLAALRGFVETLQGAARNDPTARERFLDMMSVQALRMSRLIDDLLSLSRVEMKQHVPPRDVIDLNAVAAEVAQTLAPLAEKSGAQLTLTELDAPALVIGDRDELVQATQNLVQNAIKYGGANGHVRITLKRQRGPARDSNRISLAISDDGPGIPPQHLPRLTERFYRVNAATSREMGGTGLGLAIVKHIINRHRGRLDIRSELGRGSTFEISLDAASG